jgi:2-amino-4-hydroxy-6-hydroxymethyldihydropteridine diphosphokinase
VQAWNVRLSERIILLALGANLPGIDGSPPGETLRFASDLLEKELGSFTGKSALFRTPCFPQGAGPDYVNSAIAVLSDRPARDILGLLHEIEATFGRQRVQRWGMRTLDIDLVAAGSEVLPDRATQDRWRNLPTEAQKSSTPDELILPHPRLQDRGFVLVPLAEIAPDWVHPVLGLSIMEMKDALPPGQLEGIERLSEPD